MLIMGVWARTSPGMPGHPCPRCCVARHLLDGGKHVAGFSRVEGGSQAADAVTVVTDLRESLTFRAPGSTTFGKQHGIPGMGRAMTAPQRVAGSGAAMSVDDERKWARANRPVKIGFETQAVVREAHCPVRRTDGGLTGADPRACCNHERDGEGATMGGTCQSDRP